MPRFLPMLAPLGLIANLAVATAWWYLRPEAGSLFFGVACSCGAALLSLLLTREPIAALKAQRELIEQHRGAQWYAAGLSSMVMSWIVYLNMLTFDRTPFAKAVGPRRMGLTLAWLVVGLIAVTVSHKRHHRRLKHLGFLFTGVAFIKALLYDTVFVGIRGNDCQRLDKFPSQHLRTDFFRLEKSRAGNRTDRTIATTSAGKSSALIGAALDVQQRPGSHWRSSASMIMESNERSTRPRRGARARAGAFRRGRVERSWREGNRSGLRRTPAHRAKKTWACAAKKSRRTQFHKRSVSEEVATL
jgi:hypothetical protein